MVTSPQNETQRQAARTVENKDGLTAQKIAGLDDRPEPATPVGTLAAPR
jgi:hypothetical protein